MKLKYKQLETKKIEGGAFIGKEEFLKQTILNAFLSSSCIRPEAITQIHQKIRKRIGDPVEIVIFESKREKYNVSIHHIESFAVIEGAGFKFIFSVPKIKSKKGQQASLDQAAHYRGD